MRAQRSRARRGRPQQPIPKTLPGDLHDYADDRVPRHRTQLALDTEVLTVVDDWPESIPVTEAEIEVFERWFGDVFDELLSPVTQKVGLNNLSASDKDKS